MIIPKKATLSGRDIVVMNITFPSGKKIRIKRYGEYQTADPEELDFLSKLKGISLSDIDDKALRRYVAQVEIPSIDNLAIDANNVEKYAWTSAAEDAVVEHLRKKGYEITAPPLKKYKVRVEGKVNKRDNTFYEVGDIIDSTYTGDKTIGQLIHYKWIEEI